MTSFEAENQTPATFNINVAAQLVSRGPYWASFVFWIDIDTSADGFIEGWLEYKDPSGTTQQLGNTTKYLNNNDYAYATFGPEVIARFDVNSPVEMKFNLLASNIANSKLNYSVSLLKVSNV